MKISDLELNEEARKALSVEELNEPQERALRAGLLERKNIVVASPTASGKTLIAEIAMLRNFASGGKTLYLVPLKALGSEKFAEFNEKYGHMIKIALSLGDYDDDEKWLERYDVVITSNEKADSLIRHNASFINDVTLVIADEIHMIDDASRGPTLEVVLTSLFPGRQILALSATIKNAGEIADWLGAELVQSDYRPVKLNKGVYYPTTLEIEDNKKNFTTREDPEIVLTMDAAKKGKQSLVFVSTRRSAEAAAEKIADHVSAVLTREEREHLDKASKKILSALATPTQQCSRLAACVKKGTAFHHAGLVASQRACIENAFKQGFLKTLAATPTLSYGMNLPAYRVVVRDTKRFSGNGSEPLTVMEVQQMCGRAGRPRYDKEGEAILVASSVQDANKLREKYIYGESEPVYSKLSSEPVLRTHVLSLVSSSRANNDHDMKEFFSKTFFSHQYSDIGEVMKRVNKTLALLEDLEFVAAVDLETNKIVATAIGKRVSELYLDPLSAATLLDEIKKDSDALSALISACRCIEMRPLLYVKKSDYFVEDTLMKLEDVPDSWSYEYEDFLAATKTALMLMDWCDEFNEQQLNEKYGITPGELYTKTQSAEWLLFGAAELARLCKNIKRADFFRKMQLRVKHGIKAELLSLIQLRGIGRSRARALYKNNIRTLVDARKASLLTLQKILGSQKIAESIKKQVDDEFLKKMSAAKSFSKTKQY